MDKRLSPVAFSVPATFAQGDNGTRRFAGVAYGGGVVTDHPHFDRVAFDLASTTLETPAPVLYMHRDPVGKIDLATIGGDIRIEGALFAGIAGNGAQNVAAMADEGMPWQLSVGIYPGRIDQIRAGAKVDLNGQTLDGPLTVFRNNRIRETSFVPLGADSTTSAHIFIGGTAAPSRENTDMDQATHDRIVAELTTQIAAEKARADGLAEQFATAAKERRTADVKALFAAIGKTFSDDAAKPYVDMSDAAFAVVAAEFKALKPAASAASNAHLFRAQATEGATAPNAGDLLVADAKKRFAA